MAFYAHRISCAGWNPVISILENSQEDIPGKIPAAVITGDLRAIDNKISWWKIEDVSEAQMVAAAIVQPDRINEIRNTKLILIECDVLERNFSMSQTRGDTDIVEMVDKHYDLECPDYETLGRLASVVAKRYASGADDAVKTVGKKQIKAILGIS